MLPRLPDIGVFQRLPASGTAWIHPDDVALVTRLIPSDRVFRRIRWDGVFYHYQFAGARFRLRPVMWLPLADDGLRIGDAVETLRLNTRRESFIARISDRRYNGAERRIEYRLTRPRGPSEERTPAPGIYLADQFRPLHPRGPKLNPHIDQRLQPQQSTESSATAPPSSEPVD
ncbi:MAG: hypothetical protein AAFN70_11940, partial [Planctomycetota bacterium]